MVQVVDQVPPTTPMVRLLELSLVRFGVESFLFSSLLELRQDAVLQVVTTSVAKIVVKEIIAAVAAAVIAVQIQTRQRRIILQRTLQIQLQLVPQIILKK